jgi:ketosteroid isomerase-like protein
MRRAAFAAALALAACSPSNAPGSPEAEQSLREANARYDRAIIAGDRGALDTLLAPDYTYIDARGELRDREATLTRQHGPAGTYIQSPGSEEVTIRWLGDHALVTGRFRGRITMDGSHYNAPLDERYSSIWQRQDGRWRIRHEHASMAPPPPPS